MTTAEPCKVLYKNNHKGMKQRVDNLQRCFEEIGFVNIVPCLESSSPLTITLDFSELDSNAHMTFNRSGKKF